MIGKLVGAQQTGGRRGDYLIACSAVALVEIALMLWRPTTVHWFLLPLGACGLLAGVDAVRYLRGKLDLFDPRTVIACLAFYGFFVAPILHVAWDRFGAGYDLILPNDWRPWLGAMAALNAAGLLGYRVAQRAMFRRTQPSSNRWDFASSRFYPVFAAALTLSIAGATTYLWQMGGILGEIEAFEGDKSAYVGKGWLLTLAWPLAVLSFIILTFGLRSRKENFSRWTVAIILLSLAGVSHFFLMGWYGSRSATVWALFWMAGIVHYWFRQLSARMTVAGIMLLIAFMYFYGFYKEQDRLAAEVLRTPAAWLDPRGYSRDLKGLLLEDLARADSNAFVLHTLVKDPEAYNYRWGLTYLGASMILIPHNIWPDRPDFKIDAGTEALLGKATSLTSYRVYGLSGEALLNFGPAGVVPMFVLYGSVLGWYRRKMTGWQLTDARMILAPLFTMWFANALVSDSDNLVFAIVTQGALAIVAITASSVRYPAADSTTAEAAPRRN